MSVYCNRAASLLRALMLFVVLGGCVSAEVLAKEVKVQRAKSFSDIKQGDQVKVKYVQTYLDPKEKGGEPVILKTEGTEILLVKSMQKPVEKGLLS